MFSASLPLKTLPLCVSCSPPSSLLLYYEVPYEMKLPFRDLPSLSVPSSVEMAKDDQRLMRDWRDSFGKPVRQLTVRNQSTKDNVGTLPLFAYTTPDQPPRPLDFSTADDLTARGTVVTEIEQEAVRGAIIFEANSVVVVKRDHIHGYRNRGPFFVGIVVADVTEGGEEDSDLDSDDDENPADVVFGGMPLHTTSGRTVIRPNRSFFTDFL